MRVFISHKAIGIVVATHVHAHTGAAVAGNVGVCECVAQMRAVAFAVRQVLQDRRHPMFVRIHRAARAGAQMGRGSAFAARSRVFERASAGRCAAGRTTIRPPLCARGNGNFADRNWHRHGGGRHQRSGPNVGLRHRHRHRERLRSFLRVGLHARRLPELPRVCTVVQRFCTTV